MKLLRGTGVALVTPFNEDLTIDFDGLSRLIEHCIDGGVDYLVALGTTAESATLTSQEKQEVTKHIKTIGAGRLPIVLGVGGNNTAQVVEEVKELEDDEIAAILSVSPAYNKPSQEGVYQHYAAIAAASKKPIVLYNVPGRTGSNVAPSTVARLAQQFDNIIGIKEATSNMTQVLELVHEVPNEFMVVSGDDALSLPLIAAGGVGVISVLGQGVPKHFTEAINKCLEGDLQNAFNNHLPLLKIIDLIFKEGNPAGIKSLLSHYNVCKPYVRLPLVPATNELHKAIGEALEELS